MFGWDVQPERERPRLHLVIFRALPCWQVVITQGCQPIAERGKLLLFLRITDDRVRDHPAEKVGHDRLWTGTAPVWPGCRRTLQLKEEIRGRHFI